MGRRFDAADRPIDGDWSLTGGRRRRRNVRCAPLAYEPLRLSALNPLSAAWRNLYCRQRPAARTAVRAFIGRGHCALPFALPSHSIHTPSTLPTSKLQDGLTAEIMALAQENTQVGALLGKLKSVRQYLHSLYAFLHATLSPSGGNQRSLHRAVMRDGDTPKTDQVKTVWTFDVGQNTPDPNATDGGYWHISGRDVASIFRNNYAQR